MNFDRMRGEWAAIRLMVRQQWNRLTDEDLEAIDGDRDALLNVLEQRYDSPRERLERQVSDLEGRIGSREEETAGGDAGSQVSKPRDNEEDARDQQSDSYSKTDKRSAEQSDGASKSDRQVGGQKGKQQPGGPLPSWQRQPEKRPQQPQR